MTRYKIVVCGPSGVGKTNFFKKLQGKNYTGYIETIGVDIYALNALENTFVFWECCGNPRFRFLSENHLSNSDAIVLFVDKTVDESFLDTISRHAPPTSSLFALFTSEPTVETLLRLTYFFHIHSYQLTPSRVFELIASQFKLYTVIEVYEHSSHTIPSTTIWSRIKLKLATLCYSEKIEKYKLILD